MFQTTLPALIKPPGARGILFFEFQRFVENLVYASASHFQNPDARKKPFPRDLMHFFSMGLEGLPMQSADITEIIIIIIHRINDI